MFDLFRRRDKAMRYLLTGLLGLVAISMVITLIPGYGTPSAASDNIVAEIAGEPLTIMEVQNTMNSAMRNRQITPEMLQFYIPQFVDQMILDRAIAYQAKRMGFEVTDQELASAIRSLLAGQLGTGQIDRATYERWVREQNMTVEQFEANVRKNLLLLRLQNIALEGVIVTPQEIREEFHRRNDKMKFEYVAFSPAKAAADVTVTRDEALAEYNRNKAIYKTPERRSFNLLIADEEKIAANVNIGEAELRQAYSNNIDRYRTGERVKVRHILFKTIEKPREEFPKIKAKAEEVLKQIRAGADFAEMAKKHSDDTGSAVKGGDLDWVARGQMVKDFEKAAFSLAPKQISDVIATEYGYHIVQVLDKEQARVKPFDEVKDDLLKETKRRIVYDRMQTSIEAARNELQRNPAQAQQIAEKYNLIFARAENVGPGESVPEVGTNRELEAAVQSVRVNDATPVLQVSPSRLAAAVVTGVQPPRQAEFAEVEQQLMTTLRATKAADMTRQRQQEAMNKFKTAGANIQAAAASVGGTAKSTDFLNSESTIEGVGAVSSFPELATRPVGSVAGPSVIGDQVVLIKLIDRQAADESQLAAERDKLLMTIKRRKAMERKELFEDGVVAQLTKEGKIKKYPDAIRRLGGGSARG